MEGQEALAKFKLDAIAYEHEMKLKKDDMKKIETNLTKYNRSQAVRYFE